MGDTTLICYLLSKGKGHVLDRYMSVYRIHGNGVYSALSQMETIRIAIRTQRWKLKNFPVHLPEQLILISKLYIYSCATAVMMNGKVLFQKMNRRQFPG